MNPRSSKKLLCPACKEDSHTSPPLGATLCQCGERTCACYGVQVRAGVRADRGVKATA